MTTTRTMLISGAAILAMTVLCGAEKPAAKFSELQRREIPGTGLEGVTTVAEIDVYKRQEVHVVKSPHNIRHGADAAP